MTKIQTPLDSARTTDINVMHTYMNKNISPHTPTSFVYKQMKKIKNLEDQ